MPDVGVGTAATALPHPGDDIQLDDDRPGVVLAGLPTTLVASGLTHQLARPFAAYPPSDFLMPILSAAALLRDRYEDDPGVHGELRDSLQRILGGVAAAVGRDWGVDLFQLGLDPESADYQDDVLELYRFFVCERLRNARELLYRIIVADRRRIAERYRKAVEKRNQTVAEARRIFLTFDDVVVWQSIPQALDELHSHADWSFTLAEVLARLGADPSGPSFLASASMDWTREDFAARYVAPALTIGEAVTGTALELKDRWFADSPKKVIQKDE